MKATCMMWIACWTIYLVSLFLPAAIVPSDREGFFDFDTVVGWRAALWCIRLNLEAVPIRSLGDVLSKTLLWFWPLSNVLMGLTPLMIRLKEKKTLRTAFVAMAAATLVNASAIFVVGERGRGFREGYYLWCLSFAMATVGLYRHYEKTKTF